jgi:threonine/homoserine/homoserine lactone efflux protein
MIGSSNLFIAFLAFAVVGSFTPGPNNTMLLLSGVNFGLRRTIPHLLGVTFGFALLVLVSSLGLGELFTRWPILNDILKYGCAAYLLYLAWQILKATPVSSGAQTKKPISFFQAVLFQWINPKAWLMAIIGITTYAPPDHFILNVALIIAWYIFFVFCSGSAWTLFGNWIQNFLHRPHYLRVFNVVMAILLVASLYPIFV